MTPTLFDTQPAAIDRRATYRCPAPSCTNRVTILVEHHEPPRCHNNHPSRTMIREEPQR